MRRGRGKLTDGGARGQVEYRGYGSSEGDPSEAGLKLDADATMKWVAENKVRSRKGPPVDIDRESSPLRIWRPLRRS